MHVCQGTSNKTSLIKCLVNISILLKLSLIKHTECTKQYAPLLIAAHTFLSGQNRLKPCEKEFRATTDIVQESAPRNAVKIISVPRNRATKSEKFIFDLEGACKIRLRNGSRGSLSIKCMFLCRFIRPIYFSTWHLNSKKTKWPVALICIRKHSPFVSISCSDISRLGNRSVRVSDFFLQKLHFSALCGPN